MADICSKYSAILTTIFLLYDPAVNNEMLFAEHFRVYPNVILLSNRGENNKEDFVKEAFLLYETKNYKKASDAFNKLYSISKEDYFLFYQGISLLADNNFQKVLMFWKIIIGKRIIATLLKRPIGI